MKLVHWYARVQNRLVTKDSQRLNSYGMLTGTSTSLRSTLEFKLNTQLPSSSQDTIWSSWVFALLKANNFHSIRMTSHGEGTAFNADLMQRIQLNLSRVQVVYGNVISLPVLEYVLTHMLILAMRCLVVLTHFSPSFLFGAETVKMPFDECERRWMKRSSPVLSI